MRLWVQGSLTGGSCLLDEGLASLALITASLDENDIVAGSGKGSLGPGGRSSVLRHTGENNHGGPGGMWCVLREA